MSLADVSTTLLREPSWVVTLPGASGVCITPAIDAPAVASVDVGERS